MNVFKGLSMHQQMEDPMPTGMHMMDMDMDMDDAVAIMTALGEAEGPQLKMVDLDFFNDFGDDFDDDDLD